MLSRELRILSAAANTWSCMFFSIFTGCRYAAWRDLTGVVSPCCMVAMVDHLIYLGLRLDELNGVAHLLLRLRRKFSLDFHPTSSRWQSKMPSGLRLTASTHAGRTFADEGVIRMTTSSMRPRSQLGDSRWIL